MSWAQDTKLRLQIFAIGMTLVWPGLLIWQATVTWKQITSTRWPSVTGEVRETVVKIAADKKGDPLFYGRVSYRYTVDGKEYTSDLTDLGTGAKRSDPAAAQADVSQYKPGMEVLVYYDPSKPGEGVLERGVPTNHLVVLVMLIVGTIVGAVVCFFTVRGWIRSAKQKAAENPARADQVSKNPIPEGPTDWQDAIRQFGTPEDVFKPGMEKMIAGMIIGGAR